MKWLLLLAIKIYWTTIPKHKRRACIFRVSCSQYVYRVTGSEGCFKGLQAFKFRFCNCRSGYHLFNNPVDGSIKMVLPQGQLIGENEIAERFLNALK
jgi:putative component of membrane protein insertase Oxa1/YidC/SpoIIIJ protein YidD